VNIQEYADVLNLELTLTRYANQNNRWMAKFERTDTKRDAEDCLLTGTYGNGVDPESAIGDYVDKIRGKILVHHGNSDKEQRWLVPMSLTLR